MQVDIFLEPNKNGQLLLQFEDYTYKKEVTKEEDIEWKCSDKKCLGTLVTDKFMRDPSPVRPHNHDTNGSRYRYAAKKWFQNILDKTKSTSDEDSISGSSENGKEEDVLCSNCKQSTSPQKRMGRHRLRSQTL